MTWAKLDDKILTNPKFTALSPLAQHLYIVALVNSCGHETDGRIESHEPWTLTGAWRRHVEFDVADLVAELVAQGLWCPDRVATLSGYTINNFLEYQVSRAKLDSDRSRRREHQKVRRAGQTQPKPDSVATQTGHDPDSVPSEAASRPDPTRPIEKDQPPCSSDDERVKPTVRTFADDFVAWYQAYPRHTGKKAAATRYDVVRRGGATAEQLLEGVRHYRSTEWRGREPDKIPYPSTWLGAFDPSELTEPAQLRSVPDGPTHVCSVPEGLKRDGTPYTQCPICKQVPKAAV